MRGSRASRRGVSILESVLGILVLFLATMYLLSMFVSGQRFTRRGQEYSTATFLAQTHMETLLATPADAIQAGSGGFAEPFAGYRYSVTLEDYEGDLKRVEVAVTSPRGATARLQTLRQVHTFLGVAVDPSTNRITFSLAGDSRLATYDGSSTSFGPPVPGTGARPSGLAGFPGQGWLLVADQVNPVVHAYGDATDPPRWLESFPPPDFPGRRPPRFAGAAMDAHGNRVFLADWANRAVWIFDDSSEMGPGWKDPTAPTDPPLGTPLGVATDDYGSVLWVADSENQCLRKLLLGPRVPPSPSADYEPCPAGYWHRRRFRPEAGMGAPQGVAMVPSGAVVYTVDGTHLHRLEGEIWSRRELPPALAEAGPSGLGLDPHDNVLYLNTRSGELWKHTPADGTFVRLWRR